MQDKVIAFLNEVRNYPFYKQRVRQLEEELDEVWYQMTGVKGISFDGVKGNISQAQKHLKRDAMSQKVVKIEKDIVKYKGYVDNIESVLKRLDVETADAIVDIYCFGKTYDNTAKRLVMSKGALQYRIEKDLLKVI